MCVVPVYTPTTVIVRSQIPVYLQAIMCVSACLIIVVDCSTAREGNRFVPPLCSASSMQQMKVHVVLALCTVL